MKKQPKQQLIFRNEFAHIRLTLEETSCGPRLLIEDRETDDSAYFDPIELSSLCVWPEERRAELLQIGVYEPGAEPTGIGDIRE